MSSVDMFWTLAGSENGPLCALNIPDWDPALSNSARLWFAFAFAPAVNLLAANCPEFLSFEGPGLSAAGTGAEAWIGEATWTFRFRLTVAIEAETALATVWVIMLTIM